MQPRAGEEEGEKTWLAREGEEGTLSEEEEVVLVPVGGV